MIKKVRPKTINAAIKQFPHCDQRILHAPGECVYCDKHPEWQQLRQVWGITFTGYEPESEKETLCPAMKARPEAYNKWSGNVAKPTCQGDTNSGIVAKSAQTQKSKPDTQERPLGSSDLVW